MTDDMDCQTMSEAKMKIWVTFYTLAIYDE